MTIICNVTGNERKRLAQALGAYLLWEPVYTKAPTFAYVVNNYVIDKFGTITCPDSATPEDVEQIVAHLIAEGFSPEISKADGPDEIPAEMPDMAEEPAEDDPLVENNPINDDTKLTISVPRSKVPDDVLGRLKSIIANKGVLFKRALQTDDLPIEVSDETVSFPWFTLTGMEGEGEAYAQFIAHLVKMADEQTRVLDKPYDGDNDRFAMRIFMVRMGMKGDKYALARKLMMKHLTGNSGWRYGAPPRKEEAPTDTPAEMPDVAPEAEPEAQPDLEAESAAEGAETPDVAAPEEEVPEDALDRGDDPDDDPEEADIHEE